MNTDFFKLIINNQWTVAGTTFLLTVLVVPAFSITINHIRAHFGPFSGQYISYTSDEKTHLERNYILIEAIKCRHVGNRIQGTINGVKSLVTDRLTKGIIEDKPNFGKYRFKGFVDGRVIVASYRSSLRGSQSIGSICLKGDVSPSNFTGSWSGLVEDSIENATCTWLKLPRSVTMFTMKSSELYYEKVEEFLQYYKVPLSSKGRKSRKEKLIRIKDYISFTGS